MRRVHLLLLAVWALELAGGTALLLWGRAANPRPPTPDWSLIDPLAAEEIAGQAASCASAADWRRLGDSLTAYGYFREAEACYRTAASLSDDDAEEVYRWAFSLERLGLLDEANEQYERAAGLDDQLAPGCYYFMARNRLRQERPEDAAELLAKAGRLPAARYERARLLARGADPRAALPLVNELIAAYPQAVQPHYLRYRIERLATGAEQPRLADTAALSKARLPNPFEPVFDRLTRTHQGLGSRRVVAEAGTRGDLVPWEARLGEVHRRFWTPAAADLLARAHFQRGDLRGAIRLLREVVDEDGPSAHALLWLGAVHERLGEQEKAERLWLEATTLGAPAEAKKVHAKLAGLYEKGGRKELTARHRAEESFNAGVEAFWEDDLTGARQALRRAVEENAGHAEAWIYLGETCRLLHHAEEARAAYGQALKLRPEYGRAERGLALVD